MDAEQWDDLIREFVAKQTGSFEFGALAEYAAARVKGFDADDEDRLFDLASDSEVLFEDDREEFADRFMPRHAVFKGAEFRVTPLGEEVAAGFLVPGHRFLPYLAREVFPSEAVLKLPDGSVVPTRSVPLSVGEVQRFLMYFGEYGAMEYLVVDQESNAEKLLPPFNEDVDVTVFDLQGFFEASGFHSGDSLMLTVEDWGAGIFSVRRIPANLGMVDFTTNQKWTQALRLGFEESLLDAALNHDCYEQFARMLWLAECNEKVPSVLSGPPLSLAAFFNAQKDLTLQTSGQVSFFWPEGEPLDSRMMNSLAGAQAEPATELDAHFLQLGLSQDSEEAAAYMRDALSRGEINSEAVLGRVISGRTLSFPSENDQQEFHRLWQELWDEVRSDYLPLKDVHREMRAVFLDLNDQCLQVLRGMDRNSQDPMATMNHPATLQLGELTGLIHSALVFCNQNEQPADVFPMPLAEMARALSAGIEDLSAQLQQTGPAEDFSGSDGPVYQLKISLKGVKPPIWRRVLVPASIELEQLHAVIQATFGWTNSHLHQFIDGRTFYQPGGEDDGFPGMSVFDSMGVPLRNFLRKEKDKLLYEYDFGDSWEHQVLLEKILPADPEQPLPVCIKGKRAVPPDDCGGIYGYFQMLETLEGPDEDEKEELLDWLGGPFDPEAFDLNEINAQLRKWF